VDHRRATAERNIEAILDAVETLLERRAQATIAAVAAEAGLSRVTVYAHFPTREDLLGAVVERAVRRAAAALKAAKPHQGPAVEALDRVIDAAWQELDRNRAIAQATADHLTAAEVTRTHEAAIRPIRRLVQRGRKEGAFRTDLSTDWLVTACFALLHACGDEVRAGRMDAASAPGVLTTTIRALFHQPPARPDGAA
jgi:TetR/AcrR family transcriptional regulator, mexCD-oprJ operon repressor